MQTADGANACLQRGHNASYDTSRLCPRARSPATPRGAHAHVRGSSGLTFAEQMAAEVVPPPHHGVRTQVLQFLKVTSEGQLGT